MTYPLRLRIPRESFLVLPTPSILYTLLGGIGAALAGGVFDGVVLPLAVGFGADGWG